MRKTEAGEIRIIVSPGGLEKIELFGISGDSESQEVAVEIYGKLCLEIHKFGRRAKKILSGRAERNLIR